MKSTSKRKSSNKMSKQAVNKITTVILKSHSSSQKGLTEIYVNEGWYAVGLENFKEYVDTQLPSMNYPAARVQALTGEVLFNIGVTHLIGKYSCNSLKPMVNLTSTQQKKIWEKLLKTYRASSKKRNDKKTFPAKWLTKTVVEKVMSELNIQAKSKIKLKGKSTAETEKMKQFLTLIKQPNNETESACKHIISHLLSVFSEDELRDAVDDKLTDILGLSIFA